LPWPWLSLQSSCSPAVPTILKDRFHVRQRNWEKLASIHSLSWLLASPSRGICLHCVAGGEANWPHPLYLSAQAKDRAAVKAAFAQNAIVLGYDVNGEPLVLAGRDAGDAIGSFGATGSGKTRF